MSDAQLVSNLVAWLETMRGPDGYGGPVVHWWQNCLSFTGAGLDWRYEGIINGYLTLWKRTGALDWLDKARQAGDDLLHGQLPSGNYRNSNFELNPYSGGTPHEAAADLGLLHLATALKATGSDEWECYVAAAAVNLQCYYLDRLWDADVMSFRDTPGTPSLVPNKACTLVEALFALAKWRGASDLIERYCLPTLRAVVAMQVKSPKRLAGAIPQNKIGDEVIDAYFPYYIARCIPALLLAYDHTNDEEWLEAAVKAGEFIKSHIDEDGLLPQVLYTRGVNRFPQWIAPLGDILRVINMLRPHGFNTNTTTTDNALRGGALLSGGFSTASGFSAQINQRCDPNAPPDFRDNISVVGWTDKAFTYLAGFVPESEPLPPPQTAEVVVDCAIRGKWAQWRETSEHMSLTTRGQTLYHFRKGEPWAAIVAPEVMWK